MTLGPLPAALLALFGNFLLSLGMVLQKRNVSWLDQGRGLGRLKTRAFGLWFLGFIFMNLVAVFNYLALLGLQANVVSALIGSNVAFTIILSALFMGERPKGLSLVWSAILFAALALAGFRASSGGSGFSLPGLVVFLVLPLGAGLCCFLRLRLKGGSEGLGVLFAVASGCLGGYMILAMRALQLSAGNDLLAWPASPAFYLYFAAGLASFLLLQLAYKHGRLQSVSPAYYGLQVLWPALASYFVLASPFDWLQALALAAIIISTARLSTIPA